MVGIALRLKTQKPKHSWDIYSVAIIWKALENTGEINTENKKQL